MQDAFGHFDVRRCSQRFIRLSYQELRIFQGEGHPRQGAPEFRRSLIDISNDENAQGWGCPGPSERGGEVAGLCCGLGTPWLVPAEYSNV